MIKPSPNSNVNEKLIGHVKRKLFEMRRCPVILMCRVTNRSGIS
jgi:hypothetical protein